MRVLVIDDDEGVARLLVRILRGHDVVVCHRGEDAVQRCRDGEPFDVVLCDLMMPGMTGMDVHAALATEHPWLTDRMVFLTGGAFTDGARRFLEDVPNRRLQKPFSAAELRQACAEVVRDAG